MGYKTVTVPTSVVYHYNSLAMKAGSNKKSVQKSVHIVRNRILAFYKNMTKLEFMLFLPVMLVGAPLKVRELGWSLRKQFLYGVEAIPVTMLGLQQALLMLNRFVDKRKRNLKQRKRCEWWLLKKVLGGARD